MVLRPSEGLQAFEGDGMTSLVEKQSAAWEIYRAAKVRADASLDFRDGRAAALAWRVFTALFVEERPPTPVDLVRHREVVIFPGHKARSPGGRATS